MDIRITRRVCPRTWDVLLDTGQCVTTMPLFSDLQAEWREALTADPALLCLADGTTFNARAVVALVPGKPIREDEIPYPRKRRGHDGEE